jgi:hypothetical protein
MDFARKIQEREQHNPRDLLRQEATAREGTRDHFKIPVFAACVVVDSTTYPRARSIAEASAFAMSQSSQTR